MRKSEKRREGKRKSNDSKGREDVILGMKDKDVIERGVGKREK